MIDVPNSVTRDERVSKVTAGVSALSALDRAISDRKGYGRQRQQDTLKDVEEKNQRFTDPDGNRMRNVKEAGMGVALSGEVVKTRLLKLNSNLIFKPSRIPGRMCVYYPAHDDVLGAIDRYICAMEAGIMPEFSVLNFVEEEYLDIVTDATPNATGKKQIRLRINETNPEQRGWRTVIMRLIKAGLITEPQAVRAFGTPSKDSKLWQEQFNASH